jgi:hypothetical protein
MIAREVAVNRRDTVQLAHGSATWAKDPLAPDPDPIDVPPPAGPEKSAPGIPGTRDPEPIAVPDPAPA